jgi:superfamily II DNA or RNA helicase
MKVVIENKSISITGAGDHHKGIIRDFLSYKDKSKEFQYRRMASNPYYKNSKALEKIKTEMQGCLMEEVGDEIIIPSGFYKAFGNVQSEDRRHDTGINISLPWKNKPFPLRGYQNEAVSKMENNYRGLINFATGLGKTLTALYAIRSFKKRTLVLCPNASIAENFYDELVSAFGDHKVGFYGSGKKKIKDITVGMVQSVNNNIDKFVEADLGLMIVDEVHHVPASTFYNITEKLGHIGRIFGLTATDFRADGKDVMITAGVGPVLVKRDLIWGIENGWLANPKIFVRNVPTIGREFKGDKLKNYKEHVLNNKTMNDQIVTDINTFLAKGLSVLCLVNEVAHGEYLSEQTGLKFATGKNKESNGYVAELNSGQLPGLIGTDSKIGEGTDTKNVDVLILANFVASKGALWQNLGRGLRIYEGRNKVIVIDYKPMGSSMLSRHSDIRLKHFQEITPNVNIINHK